MDSINSLLAVISGFALRLAIPIGITAILIYFLKHLDLRWQSEAQKFLSPAVEKPRCWETYGCPEDKREKCPGFQSEQPCWQVFREDSGYLQERCLGCEVFKNAPIPVNI